MMRCIIIFIPHSLTCLARFNLYDLHVADLSWYPQSKVQNNKCGRGDHHQDSFIVIVLVLGTTVFLILVGCAARRRMATSM